MKGGDVTDRRRGGRSVCRETAEEPRRVRSPSRLVGCASVADRIGVWVLVTDATLPGGQKVSVDDGG